MGRDLYERSGLPATTAGSTPLLTGPLPNPRVIVSTLIQSGVSIQVTADLSGYGLLLFTSGAARASETGEIFDLSVQQVPAFLYRGAIDLISYLVYRQLSTGMRLGPGLTWTDAFGYVVLFRDNASTVLRIVEARCAVCDQYHVREPGEEEHEFIARPAQLQDLTITLSAEERLRFHTEITAGLTSTEEGDLFSQGAEAAFDWLLLRESEIAAHAHQVQHQIFNPPPSRRLRRARIASRIRELRRLARGMATEPC